MQTNYSLISYNTHHNIKISNLNNNFFRKPVILCSSIKLNMPIRFYPGPVQKVASTITTESAKRILTLFHKRNNIRTILKDKLPEENISIKTIKTLYTMEEKKSFWKTMRDIGSGQQHILTTTRESIRNNMEYLSSINVLSTYVYIAHLNRMSEELFKAHSMPIENKNDPSPSPETKNVKSIMSYFDMLKNEAQNKANIKKEFDNFESKHKANNKIVDKEFIYKWEKYILNRKPMYKLHADELNIQNYLSNIYKEKCTELMATFNKKNVLDPFISKVDRDLKSILELENECYTTQDYQNKKVILQQIKDLIENNSFLDYNTLVVLATKLGVIEINEYGNPKITKRANEYIYSDENPIGLQQSVILKEKEVLDHLEKHAAFVLNHESMTPPNAITLPPSLSHKTMVLLLQQHAVKIAMYTSASNNNDPHTRLVGRQEINKDPEKTLKKEHISLLRPPVVYQESSFYIDLLAQGFLFNQNLLGQDVFEFYKNLILDSKHIWGTRAAIFEPVIDDIFLLKVIKTFCDNAIIDHEKEIEKHNNQFKGKTMEQRETIEDKQQEKKRKMLLQKEQEQVIRSSLPEEYTMIYTTENKIKAIQNQEKEKEKKQKTLPEFPINTSDSLEENTEKNTFLIKQS